MARRNRVIAGVVGVVGVLALWVVDAERRADWPGAARELARVMDDANRLDDRQQRLAAARLVGEYATAARWAEYERYAAAEGMAAPLVEVGEFRVTAYLVPRDGGPSDVAGNALHHGVVATDPALIPTGALVYIPALREFDRLYAPVYRIPLRELKKRKEKGAPAPETAEGVLAAVPGTDAAGGPGDDDTDGAIEGGYAVSYEARGGGWFVARDTGAAVRSRIVDVAVFSDDAYRYVTTRFPRERDEKTGKWRDVVKVYRMRYAKEWTRISAGEGD